MTSTPIPQHPVTLKKNERTRMSAPTVRKASTCSTTHYGDVERVSGQITSDTALRLAHFFVMSA